MPSAVVSAPAHVVGLPGVVPITTRSGMHKQGAQTVDTTGHTSHHLMEVVADSATRLRARFGFWSWMDSPLAAGGTALYDCALVQPGGTITRLTFNGGANTLTVANDGTSLPYYDTDELLGVTVTRGDQLYLRTFCRAQSGTAEHGATWYSDTGSLSWYQTGDHLLDAVGSAPGSPGPAYSNTYYAHPIALYGLQGSNLPSIAFYGDSNMANADQFSWYERAVNKRWPYHRINAAGAGFGKGNSANVIAQYRGFRFGVTAMGTNNYSNTIGVNLPLMRQNILNMRAQGCQVVMACTTPPSTTSTDNWVTVVNQTPHGGSAAQTTNRNDLNDAVRAMAASPGGQNADCVFDATSFVEVNVSNLFTINGNYWRVVAGSPYGTGPHYADSGMAAAGAAGAGVAALNRMVAGETGFMVQNPNLGT